MLFNRKILNLFDYFLIIGVISSSISYSLFADEFDILGCVAAISGVICVVLSAKGNILNYVFGFINVSLYAYISFKSQLYGDAALNGLYYLPMQFIGWFNWRKRGNDDGAKVKGKRMNIKEIIILIVSCVSITGATGLLLNYLNDPMPVKDSLTTVLSIIAMFLMVRAYMEQWFLWIIVNIVSLIIWIVFTIQGTEHAELMIIMWSFYLANSINGLIVWRKLSSDQHSSD